MISKFRWDFNRHQPVLEISSVPHVLPFLPANVSPVTPELISSLWLALRPQGRFRVHVLLLEYVSTFLLRLVSTLVRSFPPFVYFLLCFHRVGFWLVLSVSDI